MSVLFVVFMFFAGACESYKILALLPYPGKSHHMVFEPIFEELSQRGHHVTVISFFPSKTPHPNRRDVSLEGLAPLNVEVMDLKDYDNPSFFARKFYTQFSLVSRIMEMNVQLCEKLINSDIFEEFVQAKGDYDVILVEHFNTDCMMGIVHNYGVPSVGLMSCAMLPWTPSRVGGDDNPAIFPNMVLPFTEDMTILEQLENAFSLYFYKYWQKYVTSVEQSMLEKRLGRELPPLEEVAKNTSIVLINTHYTLNGVRIMPPSVIEVGGIHLHNKAVQPLPKDLEKWMTESHHGVILFSFGTLIRGSSLPPKRLDAIIKVFARLPQRILWKWESDELKNVSSNVLLSRWIPQYDILHHPKCVAFITHGGLLSLTEAVAAGVPSLVVPVFGDQPGNAAHAQRLGIAEAVPIHDLDEQSLYDGLIKVLSPGINSRAKAFSKLWWERPLPPMDTAIHFIEHVAAFERVGMSSQARRMNKPHLLFFKYISSISITCLVLIVVVLISCCWRRNKVKVKQN